MRQRSDLKAGALCAAIASCLLVPQAMAQGASAWVDIKDPQELRALYSGKTHRSRAFVAYYRADGAGQYQSQGADIRHPYSWALKGDQVCSGPKGGAPTCYRLQRSSKNPNEVLAHGERLGERIMLWFTVEDGIPKF
jgi:hypothetical protein